MSYSSYNMIVVTGPTASGKTRLAALIASEIGGEVISADSRQVYRNMDIGTGKDYQDYTVRGAAVPFHLVDIVEAGYKYNVFEFQCDFVKVYNEIEKRGSVAVVCGGSGMYIDSIIKGYKLIKVPVDSELRESLSNKSLDKLQEILSGYKRLHNTSDGDTVKRAIRAIEIEEYYRNNPEVDDSFPEINPLIVALKLERNIRRSRITERLKTRLQQGMVEEVKSLSDSGIRSEDLIYYGLEYKFITLYLTGTLSYEEMFSRLESAIHQFAKRQMTWFRMMERKGVKIEWIEGELSDNEKLKTVLALYRGKKEEGSST
jgi:tRNA dimethylallyltransferase